MKELKRNDLEETSSKSLMQDLRQIVDQARIHVAATANYELTMMYWHIGERINLEVLDNQRAEYGKQIVATVARQLSWSHFQIVIAPSVFTSTQFERSIRPVWSVQTHRK